MAKSIREEGIKSLKPQSDLKPGVKKKVCKRCGRSVNNSPGLSVMCVDINCHPDCCWV